MEELKKRQIEQLLEETEREILGGQSDNDDCSEISEDIMHSEYDSNTEQSGLSSDEENILSMNNNLYNSDVSYHSSDDEVPLSMRVQYYTGKDGTKWSRKIPNQRVRISNYNRVTEKSGVENFAKCAKSIKECWSLFFTKEMILHIVFCTNIYINQIQNNFSRDRDANETDITEMYAVIGILYTIGML